MLKFEKIRLSDVTYEAASVFDLNLDGKMELVCGEYWFEGPDFKTRHKICDVRPEGDYFDDFSDFPMDVNGDGYPDIITGGWWGETLRWRENPQGKPELWKVHDIDHCGNIETIRYWDVDGDGELEIVPNTPGVGQKFYKLVRNSAGKGTGRFTRHIASTEPSGHGLGFGDLNGDGRGEIILANGWLEPPDDPLNQQWIWHPEFNLGCGSVPMLVHDVNGDGLADLIVGQAHGYGLDWWEQGCDAQGIRTWTKHEIDPSRSQYHDMILVDLDNDGELELLTGKRYWAHCGHDPGETDPIGLYYFKINGGKFERFTIDYGDPTEASGSGIYMWVEDLTGNGYKDIIAPGKEGLYLFRNLGPA